MDTDCGFTRLGYSRQRRGYAIGYYLDGIKPHYFGLYHHIVCTQLKYGLFEGYRESIFHNTGLHRELAIVNLEKLCKMFQLVMFSVNVLNEQQRITITIMDYSCK